MKSNLLNRLNSDLLNKVELLAQTGQIFLNGFYYCFIGDNDARYHPIFKPACLRDYWNTSGRKNYLREFRWAYPFAFANTSKEWIRFDKKHHSC